MLNRVEVEGFKSLRSVAVDLPRLCVMFGPIGARFWAIFVGT